MRNKGCAGLSYHLEYVEKPGKFDEVVEQDGVRVLIDSKALFSIIGSEMDWTEDALRYASHFIHVNSSYTPSQLQILVQEPKHHRCLWVRRVIHCWIINVEFTILIVICIPNNTNSQFNDLGLIFLDDPSDDLYKF